MMKLKTLLQGLPLEIKGKKDIDITGLCSHSKKVAPGNLFIAKKGFKTDGSLFIEEAVKAGAAAVVTDLYNPFLNLTQIIIETPQEIEAILAQRFYHHPSQELFLVGITGTNGKTTTSYLVKHLLEETPHECGLIGTIESIIKDHRLPAERTTPDVITLHHYLRDMVQQKCTSAVMEVSSHALVQGRVAAIDFDVCVFTNLGQDHLDYHHTIENYAAAKALLFSERLNSSQKNKKVAVVNLDDPYTPFLLKENQTQRLSYALKSPQADLRVTQLSLSGKGSVFDVEYLGKKIEMSTSLVGRFNVYNSLAAVGVALAKGISLERVAARLKTFSSVPGRLQKVATYQGAHVYIDFAHTEKALDNVLSTLKEFATGKIVTVFGCGGDRDQEKRPKMARVAEIYSDTVILTSDNPRSEDPEKIIHEMLKGITHKDNVYVEIDRKTAIEKALSLATSQDTVLIAGKGHESTQIFRDKVIPFSDKAVIEQYCLSRLC